MTEERGELENANGHENETVQCGGPANEAGHYAPPPRFFYAASQQFAIGM